MSNGTEGKKPHSIYVADDSFQALTAHWVAAGIPEILMTNVGRNSELRSLVFDPASHKAEISATAYVKLGGFNGNPTLSPDGRWIAFTRGDINPIAREEYRGSSNRDIWLYDTKKKTFLKLPGTPANDPVTV